MIRTFSKVNTHNSGIAGLLRITSSFTSYFVVGSPGFGVSSLFFPSFVCLLFFFYTMSSPDSPVSSHATLHGLPSSISRSWFSSKRIVLEILHVGSRTFLNAIIELLTPPRTQQRNILLRVCQPSTPLSPLPSSLPHTPLPIPSRPARLPLSRPYVLSALVSSQAKTTATNIYISLLPPVVLFILVRKCITRNFLFAFFPSPHCSFGADVYPLQ